MWCGRYNKSCEEELYYNCDVPSNSNDREEQLQECKECIFCDEEEL